MRRLIVVGLESTCTMLDRIPTWHRDGRRLRRFRGGWGCRIGLARWSCDLDHRWQTGEWLP